MSKRIVWLFDCIFDQKINYNVKKALIKYLRRVCIGDQIKMCLVDCYDYCCKMEVEMKIAFFLSKHVLIKSKRTLLIENNVWQNPEIDNNNSYTLSVLFY